MSPILKKLVDISVWVLFVGGCVALVLGIVFVLIRAPQAAAPLRNQVPGLMARPVGSPQLLSLGVFSVFLSVVATWFRKIIG
jgi:hypothetical protein